MDVRWLLLLLLLSVRDGALDEPDINTTQGVESDATASTKDSVPLGTIVGSSTTSALSNKHRDQGSAVPPNSLTTRKTTTSESQKRTTPITPPTSPQASSSAEYTEQADPTHETQEEKLNTTIITTSKGPTLSNSTMTSALKDQGGTSQSTVSPRTATSAEILTPNQTAPTETPLAGFIGKGLESSVATSSHKSTMITAPAVLNRPSNDIRS
ncbi:Polycystic Kidney Disease Protein 1-Like 1 [Manis pentadactyla]|nr:Polycystic Kidney Disease Protein 1-Like 1 [Manis pentadactyla]